MLRHYDKLGLLLPQHIDESSGYRYYTAQQLGVVGKIGQLRELGFSLALIKEILDDQLNPDDLKRFYKIHYYELQEELQLIRRQVEQLSHLLQQDEIVNPYHVTLKEIPARTVISNRRIIHSYEDEGQLWQELYQAITRSNINIAQIPYAMAIFHDLEYKTDNIDVEVQLAIESKEGSVLSDIIHSNYEVADVDCYQASSTEVVSVIFSGSYSQMSAVTQSVAHFIEDNQYELQGPMFNIYHVSIAHNSDPRAWVTEACFPLRT
jgi:DNA-binding transcriptional MerR regulator